MSDKIPLYDSFSAEYDLMVSWPDRLQRETPFLQSALSRRHARRVLDVGTGTGWHAIHLAGLGLEAVGADPSAEMVRRAAENARDVAGVRFVQAGFGELQSKVGETFDALTCLGNTLPHALDQAQLLRALSDMAAVLRPGGVLVVQQLNYDRILAEGQRFLGLTHKALDDREYLFFRFYDYTSGPLTFNVVILQRDERGAWTHRVESTRLQAIISSQLGESLARCGFTGAELYGSYAGERYSPLASNDLIVVAERE